MGKADIIDYLYHISVIFLIGYKIRTIGYIDCTFGKSNNIGIGIGYNRLYRLQFWDVRYYRYWYRL